MLSDPLCLPTLLCPVPLVHVSHFFLLFMVGYVLCHIAHHCLYICIFVVLSPLGKIDLNSTMDVMGLMQNDTDRLSSTLPGPPGPSGAFQNTQSPHTGITEEVCGRAIIWASCLRQLGLRSTSRLLTLLLQDSAPEVSVKQKHLHLHDDAAKAHFPYD